MGPSIAFVAVLAALAAQSVPAEQQAPLKPAGPWNVEYADSMCILAREFGEGEAKVTLGFKPGLFSKLFRIVLVRSRNQGRLLYGDAQLSFDGATPIAKPYIEQFIKGRGQQVFMIDLEEADLAPLVTARHFWVRAGNDEFLLAPSAVPKAMKALEACEKDLLVSWGMDAKVLESIATFPKGRVTAMFTTSDYPRSALRNREQGTAGARFWVTKDGRVRDCKIVESSGSATLDAQTCAIVTRRGRLDPARTNAGEIVESISFVRVRWLMPGS